MLAAPPNFRRVTALAGAAALIGLSTSCADDAAGPDGDNPVVEANQFLSTLPRWDNDLLELP